MSEVSKQANVNFLLITAGVVSVSLGLAYPYFSEYTYSLTGSPIIAGLVSSVRSVVCISSFVVGGLVADTLGRKKPIFSGTFVLGYALIVYATSQTVYQLLIAAVLEGIAYFYFPAFNAMIMDSTSDRRLLKVFTMVLVVEHLPYSVSPFVGGFMRDSYGIAGLRICYAGGGALTLLMASLRMRFLTETLKERKRGQGIIVKAYLTLLKDFKQINPFVKELVILRSLVLLNALAMFDFFLVLYAVRDFGIMNFTEFGMAFALASLSFLGAVPLSARIGSIDRAHLYGSLLLLESLAPLFVLSNSKLAIFISLVVLNVCGALTYALERSSIAIVTEQTFRGRAESFMNISFYVGAAIGTMIGGYLYSIDPRLVMKVAFLLFFSGALLGHSIFKKLGKG